MLLVFNVIQSQFYPGFQKKIKRIYSPDKEVQNLSEIWYLKFERRKKKKRKERGFWAIGPLIVSCMGQKQALGITIFLLAYHYVKATLV